MECESLNHSHYLVPILPEDAEILARDMSQTVADWPSGAPGVFPVGRCTMWAGSSRKYKEWIIVNLRSLYPSIGPDE